MENGIEINSTTLESFFYYYSWQTIDHQRFWRPMFFLCILNMGGKKKVSDLSTEQIPQDVWLHKKRCMVRFRHGSNQVETMHLFFFFCDHRLFFFYFPPLNLLHKHTSIFSNDFPLLNAKCMCFVNLFLKSALITSERGVN